MSFVTLFVFRWFVNAFGLWLTVRLFGTGHTGADFMASSGVFLIAGLILTFFNILLRPLVTIVSFPFIILTLGLFMLVVNGLMVYFAFQLTPGISVTFGTAIVAGIIIGLINFVINDIANARRVDD